MASKLRKFACRQLFWKPQARGIWFCAGKKEEQQADSADVGLLFFLFFLYVLMVGE